MNTKIPNLLRQGDSVSLVNPVSPQPERFRANDEIATFLAELGLKTVDHTRLDSDSPSERIDAFNTAVYSGSKCLFPVTGNNFGDVEIQEVDYEAIAKYKPLFMTFSEEGLKPLDEVDNVRLTRNRDNSRKINNSLISFSIEFTNYMYLRSLIETHGNVFCVLFISLDAFYDKEVLIYKSNPAILRWGKAKSIKDLFFEEHQDDNLDEKYTTDPRAEIRTSIIIKPDSIKKVIYPMSLESELIKIRNLYTDIDFQLNQEQFDKRSDYKHWEEIRKKGVDIHPLET